MRYFLRTTDQSAAEDVVISVEDEKFLLGDCHVFRAFAASFLRKACCSIGLMESQCTILWNRK